MGHICGVEVVANAESLAAWADETFQRASPHRRELSNEPFKLQRHFKRIQKVTRNLAISVQKVIETKEHSMAAGVALGSVRLATLSCSCLRAFTFEHQLSESPPF